jgi:hypothetical protein
MVEAVSISCGHLAGGLGAALGPLACRLQQCRQRRAAGMCGL